jgi:predicted cobalt transporter CbtA
MARTTISRVPYAIGNAVKAPAEFVHSAVGDTTDLLGRSGELKFGQGMIATIVALTLGFLCLLGVLAFHFPEYLTTPELRHQYSVDVLRQAMFVALLVAGALALANLVLGVRRNLNLLAFVLVIAAVALGGSRVPVGNFPDHTPYIGLDWFILDLLGSTVVFVVIEKLFPLYKGQAVFRRE